mgnify:FL=1
MKLSIKKLKQMIQEEIGSVQEVGGYAPDTAAEEQALVAALQQANRTLGEEEVARIFNDLMNSPDSAPMRGGGDPFEDHPDNEQGSVQRRFESKKKK